MAQLAGWMPTLLKRINWACEHSFFVRDIHNTKSGEDAVEVGKNFCLDLWPFIRDLPSNVALVRDSLPPEMEAAKKLLGQLADDERRYQQLYIDQCLFAGLTVEDLDQCGNRKATYELCRLMTQYCQNFREGILAIVTAELAATAFSRVITPFFEKYVETHPDKSKSQDDIDAGLAWMRLHAKPHTRHAIWLKRMLEDIHDAPNNDVPPPVESILEALYTWWNCPAPPGVTIRETAAKSAG